MFLGIEKRKKKIIYLITYLNDFLFLFSPPSPLSLNIILICILINHLISNPIFIAGLEFLVIYFALTLFPWLVVINQYSWSIYVGEILS